MKIWLVLLWKPLRLHSLMKKSRPLPKLTLTPTTKMELPGKASTKFTAKTALVYTPRLTMTPQLGLAKTLLIPSRLRLFMFTAVRPETLFVSKKSIMPMIVTLKFQLEKKIFTVPSSTLNQIHSPTTKALKFKK